MQRLALFLTAIFMFLFISCDPCRNLDCVTSNYSAQFRILRSSDGKDLVFGPNAIYNKNAIKFYTLKGADTLFFAYETRKFAGAGYDSILYVNFFPETNTPAFLKLSATDTDTLVITYDRFSTRCCGNITEITKFRYNNIVDIPGKEGTQEIRK